jgi:RsiW-degrading membrane proteinase PrsW (M82 family)
MVTDYLNLIPVFVIAAIPALVWLLFFLKEDLHPEPKKMLAITFLAGMASSIPVLFIELVFQKIAVTPLHSILLFIIGIAIIEEVFKFFATYLVNAESKYLDEPIDAMIYMITAALGFATIENFFVVRNSLDIVNLKTIFDMLNAVSLRFVGATLLHALASGIVGYYWALDRFKKKRGAVLVGLFIAAAVHAIFNFFVVQFQSSDIFYPTFFLVFIAFWVLADFERTKRISNGV